MIVVPPPPALTLDVRRQRIRLQIVDRVETVVPPPPIVSQTKPRLTWRGRIWGALLPPWPNYSSRRRRDRARRAGDL